MKNSRLLGWGIKHLGSAACRLILCGLAWEAAALDLAPEPPDPGRFPMVSPFVGEFRFGWSGIEAGRARAGIKVEGQRVEVEVRGGTTGWVRSLWLLDAHYRGAFFLPRMNPVEFEQAEKYANRTLRTQAIFGPAGVRRWRQREPGPAARWKTFALRELRDVVSAMFYIRSQRLAPGDVVRLPVFPGDSPFLVEVTSHGRCKFEDAAALRLELRIQRIRLQRREAPALEPFRKFRRATVWISDDAHRLPLRAEVEVFIGKVYGELRDVCWADGSWYFGRGFE